MSTNVYTFGYRAPRYPADFKLLLQAAGPPPLLLDGHCVDISEDGLRATFETALEVGAAVTLILPVARSSTSLRIAARLTNRQCNFHGFNFTFSSEEERDYMQGYVDSMRSPTTRPAYPTQ
jgi:hypothetical protein